MDFFRTEFLNYVKRLRVMMILFYIYLISVFINLFIGFFYVLRNLIINSTKGMSDNEVVMIMILIVLTSLFGPFSTFILWKMK